MKKYLSILLYVAILMFGLFVFTYKPSTENKVPEFETVTQESIEEEQYTSFLQPQTQNVVVKDGDTFRSILEGIEVDEKEAVEIANAYKKVYDVHNAKVGQVFNISSLVDPQTNTTEIIEIVTEPEKGKKYILQKMDVTEDDTTEYYKSREAKSKNNKIKVKENFTMDKTTLNEEAITVEKGDSFIDILTKKGLDYDEATSIYQAYKKVYDARNAKVGQVFNISSVVDPKYNDMINVTKIMTEPVSGTRYIVEKNADGKYEARVEQDDLKEEFKTVSGIINGTVAGSMKAAGVPGNVVGNFINIFSFSVDFRRDVRAGDKFKVAYERKLSPSGQVVKTGDIVYAELTLGRTKTALYRFKDGSGTVDYYDENGLALKKSLDRKPLEYKKARVSSKFSSQNPAVVYDAPMNTKVYASADGTVTTAKWVKDYGNYITIRHDSEYSTSYGHLKSYATGIRPGVRVKQGQVIGYVGSTDSSSSGLLFEVMKNDQKVDPLKVRAAIGENLQGEKLKEFQGIVSEINDFINENKPIQNPKIYEFSGENVKYTAYIEKDKNIEILESLQRRLPKNIMQAIDTMEVKIDNDKMYSATVYIKHGYEYGYKNIAYQVVQEILNILLTEGRSPFHEHMSVFAFISQKVKGVTGQNMVNPFGNAFYDYTNDTIQWEDWKRHIFF